MTMFALMPGVGSLVSKIPGVKQLGSKGITSLVTKLTKGGGKNLTKLESDIIKGVSSNQELVKSELNNYVKNLASQSAQRSKSFKNSLINISKSGLNFTKQASVYAAAGEGYNKTYDIVQAKTPKVKSSKEGLNWDFVKSSFGSSGNEQDNKLLSLAWDKGWRPGNVVPQEFQTKQYREQYKQEIDGIESLKSLVAQAKKL